MTKRERDLIEKSRRVSAEFRWVAPAFFTRQGIRQIQFTNGNFVLDGRPISLGEMQYVLGKLDIKLAKIIESYVDKLASREWTLEKWKEEMIALLEGSHLIYAALAVGSVTAVLSSQSLENFERIVSRQAEYLTGFVRDINTEKYGTIKQSVARIKSRAKSYVRALRITHQKFVLDLHKKLGFKEAKRILTAVESCTRIENTEGCLDIGGIWMPIKSMPPIGTLVCGAYCKCYLVFR